MTKNEFETKEEGAVTTTLTADSLTATDRCDRCGAQAYVRVQLASGSELLFCAHHARAYEPKLRELAASIQDESEKLLDTSATATAEER
jgi:hypothetical protein